MILFKKTSAIVSYLKKFRNAKTSVGFVPTMGALHQGHLSLISESKKQSQLTVCSIFVNRTQFNNATDFKKYPVTIEKDVYALETNGCDILFLPDENEIYPGTITPKHFELGYLETILEGKYRPGHFQGVCQVVERLLKIIEPASLFIGQKDYQQCMVIKKLLALMHSNIHLVICPTLREKDGLAMSSRNLLLNEEQRAIAPEIYNTLLFIKKNIKPGDVAQLKKQSTDFLISRGFKVDYVEIADAGNLKIIDEWDGELFIIALIAAFINDTRLIDNLPLTMM